MKEYYQKKQTDKQYRKVSLFKNTIPQFYDFSDSVKEISFNGGDEVLEILTKSDDLEIVQQGTKKELRYEIKGGVLTIFTETLPERLWIRKGAESTWYKIPSDLPKTAEGNYRYCVFADISKRSSAGVELIGDKYLSAAYDIKKK